MKNKIHKRFYNLMANMYDVGMSIYFSKDNTSPRNAITKLISDCDNNLLEICAGTCQNSIAIAKTNTNIKIVAVDRAVKMLEVAQANIEKSSISNIEVKIMDATKLEIEDKSFDVIVISLVLHELEETLQQKILLEARRVIKDSGKLIVVEWDRPKTVGRKIKFSFIELIEPESYKRLIQQDMFAYFDKVGFEIAETMFCDYTKVFKLRKSGTEPFPLE